VKKLVICALALGGIAASAQAADLSVDSLKDPLPDSITYKGVTVYGTLDVGYGYETHGAPPSGPDYTVQNYNMYGAKQNREAISSLTANALSQSFVGVKAEESIGYGFTAIGKLETGFNPLSGELADVCASMVRVNGKLLTSTEAYGDGSRCGQGINGVLYAGISSATFGTLTVGRQNSLALDLMSVYDPQSLAYSMSLIGWSGGAGSGTGATETARWDNSIRYAWQYGPVHITGQFADGEQDSSLHGSAGAVSGGFGWKGLSVDAQYNKDHGAILSSPFLLNPNGSFTLPTVGCTGGLTGCNELSGTAVDIEAWTVGAKYVYDFGGGWKDEGPTSKITFYGGFQHSDLSNSSVTVSPGDTTIGGYILGTVNNTPYGTTRTLETAWAGAKYEMGPWAFTGAYYHLSQNQYVAESATHGLTTCAAATSTNVTNKGLGKFYGNQTQGANCSGDTETVSFLVDYTFTKHFDVYAGVNYSDISGGLASGYLATDNTTFVSGMRLKF
jgi:predicted porin